ncbi:carbohydrate kinase [Nocardioides sp. AE5]|uniref:carbohydrate kinase n=1 Tax=Nocardioides sp. AE5 TaxID=2962573 RepID=UPI002881E899|nr:carbohydrate kinase [Nocardioides sp. AE5]MDT0201715.1 winged helix-turn-helix transcriptional regulator [Nocardioides sp. AE5]
MELTDREQEIVALLRRDPLASSEAIARALGSTRQAVNVHLSNLGKKGVILGRGYILSDQPAVVVIGGANIDVKAHSLAPASQGTSNPGRGEMTPGGVGRNIAENLARLGTRTHLVANVGTDPIGDGLLAATSAAGVHVEHVRRTATATGTYTAILDADGELVIAVADMAASDEMGPEAVEAARDLIGHASHVVLDGNLAAPTLARALDLCHEAGTRIVVEPVSVAKARLLSPALVADRPVFAVTPNADELTALTDLPARTDRQLLKAAAQLHDRGVEHVWVRLGGRGSLLSSTGSHVFLDAHPIDVVDVTGAGDAALAAFVHALLDGKEPVEAAAWAHVAAALTINSPHTVRPDLTARLVTQTATGGTR